MNNNNNNNTFLIHLVKRTGDFIMKDLWAPMSRFVKYPVFLSALLGRIHTIGAMYNINLQVRKYRINPEGIALAKKEMKGQGGIYIWYCHVTGFFYLGSAKLFFGDNGRLSTYLMPSRLTSGRSVSPDISKALKQHGYSNFTVIIVESHPYGSIAHSDLFMREQLWMLLYPTYNRSLTVGSNAGAPMSEEDRVTMSTPVYIYELDSNGIIANSEQCHYGIKNLTRTGFYSMFDRNTKVSISYFDLNPLLKSVGVYQNRFLITTTRLEGDELTNWTLPIKLTGVDKVKGTDTRTTGVWAYKANASNLYTESDLIQFYASVTECREAYNISKTQFQRLRKYSTPHKGVHFSDFKKH